MAKTTHCAICGKEITTGLFKGDALPLVLGAYSYDCCEECHTAYTNKAAMYRFDVKMKNLKYKNRSKINAADVLQMYRTYLQEEADYMARHSMQTPIQYGFACYAGNRFSVRECAMDELNLSNADFLKKTLKQSSSTGCTTFAVEDITCIEYCRKGPGQSLGLFKRAYVYYVRLNDHRTITYRPCITRAVVRGFAPFFHKSAEKELLKELEELRRRTGTTLPIVKVKKFG